MSDIGRKIISGLKEAVRFARGECEHEWVGPETLKSNPLGIKRYCKKCGVSLFDPVQ